MDYKGIKITESVNSYTLYQSNWTVVLIGHNELRVSSVLWTLLKIDFWKWFNGIEQMIVCIDAPGGTIRDTGEFFSIGRQ